MMASFETIFKEYHQAQIDSLGLGERTRFRIPNSNSVAAGAARGRRGVGPRAALI